MSTDYFNLGRGYAYLAGKKRTQLGICFAALRRCGDADLQRTIRQLARDFGFRTLRDYLNPERGRDPLPDSLFEELMHGLCSGERGLESRQARRRGPLWPNPPLQ